MNDIDKLRVMLPHWIEHNQGHAREFSQWAEKLASDAPETAALLHKAVHSLQEAQNSLEEALQKAGGPLADHKHQDHGHHHAGHHHS
ncbi:MAG: hypothetical protein ACL93V_01295 [Candidatus Electrothrix sp. YB6]